MALKNLESEKERADKAESDLAEARKEIEQMAAEARKFKDEMNKEI